MEGLKPKLFSWWLFIVAMAVYFICYYALLAFFDNFLLLIIGLVLNIINFTCMVRASDAWVEYKYRGKQEV